TLPIFWDLIGVADIFGVQVVGFEGLYHPDIMWIYWMVLIMTHPIFAAEFHILVDHIASLFFSLQHTSYLHHMMNGYF
ncbi:hypothetical protein ACJX0J_009927, partial [Zea mays]